MESRPCHLSAAAARATDPAPRCLARPARLTLRQTRRAAGGRAGESTQASRTLNVAHLNPRSLLPSMDDVIDAVSRECIDVLGVSESWLKPSVTDEFVLIPGFSVIRNDRRSGRGGGVCVFYRDGLRPERLRVPMAGSQLETLWLSFGRSRGITVGVAYRPPRGAALPYIEDLRTQLVHVMGLGRPVCLLGDMNFDLLSPAKPGVASYAQLLSDLHMSQLIRQQTHQDGSLLDHIVIPESDVKATARVIPFNSSDHDLVLANLKIPVVRDRQTEVVVRSSRRLDRDALCCDLLTADWSSVYALPGVGDKWRGFLDVWSPIIDTHMPLVTVKLRHPPCPWLDDNPELREMMRERDAARAERDRDRCGETERRYRQCRNDVKGAQARARSAFFEASLKNSRKQTWKDIRKFIVASGKRGGAGSSGAPVTDRTREWAEKLNRHFSSVGPSIAASLSTVAAAGPQLSPRPPRVCSGAFRVRPATLPELSSALTAPRQADRTASRSACSS